MISVARACGGRVGSGKESVESETRVCQREARTCDSSRLFLVLGFLS